MYYGAVQGSRILYELASADAVSIKVGNHCELADTLAATLRRTVSLDVSTWLQAMKRTSCSVSYNYLELERKEHSLLYLTMIALALAPSLLLFLLWHLNLVRKGWTTNERLKWNQLRKKSEAPLVNSYDCGFFENFRQVFCPSRLPSTRNVKLE